MASSVGGVVSIDFENTAHPAVEQLDTARLAEQDGEVGIVIDE